jgi:aryl-alcohol dehydrogenase-like predicted oxidoreductase
VTDPARLGKFKANLVDQICEASEGPCTYEGLDMKTAHRGMGVSDADFDALVEDAAAERLAQALTASAQRGYPTYQTLQPHYNLYERAGFEGALAELCVRENIGVITYFSLGAGFLTGKYRGEADFSKSPRGAGMQKYLNPRGLRILAALEGVSIRCGATMAQVALAWLMQRPGVTAPIASATSVAQLDELMAATRLNLDADAVATLDEASA